MGPLVSTANNVSDVDASRKHLGNRTSILGFPDEAEFAAGVQELVDATAPRVFAVVAELATVRTPT